MTKTKRPALQAALARKVAVEAGADPRTVQRVVQGLPVRPLAADRIRKALASLGLVAVLAVLVACSSSGAGMHGDADSPSRGRQPYGGSVDVRTVAMADALPQAQPDAGMPVDALAPPDLRPADTRPPLAQDTMPDTTPDAWVQVDTTAQLPDTLMPDTRRSPDAMLVPACRWSNKLSGDSADVYLAEPAARCGVIPGTNTSCNLGCLAVSIMGGTVEKLSSKQAIDPINETCRAYFLHGDAAVESPGLCFSDAEACAKMCRP